MNYKSLILLSAALVSPLNAETFLVFGGKTGWIGQKIISILEEQNHIAIATNVRLENREEILREIQSVQPDLSLMRQA